MSFQYSPYHAKKQGDECTPETGFRVWVEAQDGDSKLEKYWDATSDQRSNVQKRDACALPTSTTTAQITQPPKALSCEYLNADPDQGHDAVCVCDLTTLPLLSAFPTGSQTLGFQSDLCGYTAIPGTVTNPVSKETEVWTSNCQACTLVGGIADHATCTWVSGCHPTATPTPTVAAWVGNLSTVEIGNAADGNNGTDLAKEVFTKLRAFCNDTSCQPNQVATFDNVEVVIKDGEEPLKPAMYLQDTQYSSPTVLEQMLTAGIASWVAALNSEQLNLCKDVEYEAEADETGYGCGTGPITPSRLRRKVRRDTGEILWEREGLTAEDRRLKERCKDDCGTREKMCHYVARMCNAPNEITVVMSVNKTNPYANHLNIGVKIEAEPGPGFLCEEAMAALTAAMVVIAPELVSADVLEGVELETLCGAVNDPLG